MRRARSKSRSLPACSTRWRPAGSRSSPACTSATVSSARSTAALFVSTRGATPTTKCTPRSARRCASAIAARGVTGIDVCRGVEDERAFDAGMSNRVTADGIVLLLRAIRDARGFSAASSKAMIDILMSQELAGGIAPGLPEPVRAVARVAHKTGDICTVSHDAGLVFLPGRPPYVVAILVAGHHSASTRTDALVAISGLVYETVAAAGEAA